MADVFVSYSRTDEARVEMLVRALEAHRISVWWDRSLEQGANFPSLIRKEISDAGAVIVCWSDAASDSRWVSEEADEANHLKKYVGCLIAAGRAGMGYKTLNNINLQAWNGAADDRQLLTLLHDVGRRIGRDDIAELAAAEEYRQGEESRRRQAEQEAARVKEALERKRAEEARQAAATATQRERVEVERNAHQEAQAHFGGVPEKPSNWAVGCGTAAASLAVTSIGVGLIQAHVEALGTLLGIAGCAGFWIGIPVAIGMAGKMHEAALASRRERIDEYVDAEMSAFDRDARKRG